MNQHSIDELLLELRENNKLLRELLEKPMPAMKNEIYIQKYIHKMNKHTTSKDTHIIDSPIRYNYSDAGINVDENAIKRLSPFVHEMMNGYQQNHTLSKGLYQIYGNIMMDVMIDCNTIDGGNEIHRSSLKPVNFNDVMRFVDIIYDKRRDKYEKLCSIHHINTKTIDIRKIIYNAINIYNESVEGNDNNISNDNSIEAPSGCDVM